MSLLLSDKIMMPLGKVKMMGRSHILGKHMDLCKSTMFVSYFSYQDKLFSLMVIESQDNK